MTTYTKETALYDTGAISGDITEAGQTAERYITAIDSNGIKVHAENNPSTNYTKINASGMEVHQAVNGTDTIVASFGSSGATIGRTGAAHSVIDANGQKFYANNGSTLIANLGYGSTEGDDGTSATTPYFTFGNRVTSSDIGAYSVGIGTNIVASGSKSLAGGVTEEREDDYVTASGVASVSFGRATNASGHYSQAFGHYTSATNESQMVVGRANVTGNYPLIVGNGTVTINQGDISIRKSNALTVDWDGNVEAAGALFANGAEFSKPASNHLVIGGYHVCWGTLTVSSPTLNAYAEQTVTLPYTYTGVPVCFASCAGRAARHRTAYASQGDQTGNKIRVGYYTTASGAIYISYLTIGV